MAIENELSGRELGIGGRKGSKIELLFNSIFK
jgi:hypothetical protein